MNEKKKKKTSALTNPRKGEKERENKIDISSGWPADNETIS